jgi:hypothetical protein
VFNGPSNWIGSREVIVKLFVTAEKPTFLKIWVLK